MSLEKVVVNRDRNGLIATLIKVPAGGVKWERIEENAGRRIVFRAPSGLSPEDMQPMILNVESSVPLAFDIAANDGCPVLSFRVDEEYDHRNFSIDCTKCFK